MKAAISTRERVRSKTVRSTPRSSGRRSRQRGMTLAEVVIGAGLTSTVLIAGVGTFLVGMRSWAKGQTAIDTLGAAQKSTRVVSNALRPAMSVSVGNSGNSVSFQLPKLDVGGGYVTPLVWDGVTRSFQVSNGVLTRTDGNVTRTIAKDLVTTDNGSAYQYFSGGSTTLLRSLTIQFVTSKPGFRNEKIVSRARETIYLRNIPQLSR